MNQSQKTKIIFVTLGCRVNQYESTYWIKQISSKTDAVVVTDLDEKPDIAILNSCVVTKEAERDTRKLIRKFKREHPDMKIILTGCYARLYHEKAKIETGIIIADSFDYKKNEDIIFKEAKLDKSNNQETEYQVKTPSKNRPPLLIQTGCNKKCAYCIIPYVRGKSRSRSISNITEEYLKMLDSGIAEIVLTGINLGSWGRDFSPVKRFEDLLEILLNLTPEGHRLRIGSIEPEYVTDKVIELFSHPGLAPHIHLPLQGGTDRILKLMRRPSKIKDYAYLTNKLIKKNHLISIGADIIAGFPTETDKEHTETLNLIKDLPIAYLHVFPYSARQGTPAALMKQIPKNIIKQRAANLRNLHVSKKTEFLQKLIGITTEVVWEKPISPTEFSGMAGQFIQVKTEGSVSDYEKSELIKVKITSSENLKVSGVKICPELQNT